ncbi:MAG: shikimate kinase / 3-dehydroquinate synthase [Solirubrobacteraceae bacterium]|nr:shikimate kinase / 3-dehydroquinate synthase [Solirubrobacteraceae bacterium]
MTSRALVLVGFMGAGKTTAARAVAEALGVEAVDADELLKARLGMPIAQFFDEHGEAAFRAEEEALVVELLGRGGPGVVALGGGSVVSAAVRDALGAHRVLWLDVGVEQAWARASGHDRPLARDRERFGALHAERLALYEEVADGLVPAAAVSRALPALVAWTTAPPGTQLVWAASPSAEYPVFAGEGLLEAGFYPVEGRRFLVTDGGVARWYAGLLEPTMGTAMVMPGEASKTVAHAEIVWTEMATAGVTLDDHVTALGGGVVGDLAGFCAATYQRGIRLVGVPTTLVAQVDSAYGGKTGVDLVEAKNYVGAYHHPAAVLTDPATLRTLPAEERAAGYAEVVKTALIAGGELWERVRSRATDGTDLDAIVACARTKLAVVAADERDAGGRQVLNLGHTIAHAIETATGYARYRHGEAVALGLLVALRLSGQDELREEVAALLETHGLPLHIEDDVDLEAVELATARDKKRRGEAPVPFVLVEAPGNVSYGHAVEPDALRAALKELAS